MHKLLLTIAILLIASATTTAQTLFDISSDEVRAAAKVIRSTAKDVAASLATEWRTAHTELTAAEQDSILQGAETLTANRYRVTAASADTSVVSLSLAEGPVGLVVLTKNGKPLGSAYVNEDGLVEYDVAKESNEALKAVADQMGKGNRYVICGIEQPYKLFHNDNYKEYATDIRTGETAVYDSSTLPDSVFEGQKHHTAAVIGSVAGGLAAVAIIVLCVVL